MIYHLETLIDKTKRHVGEHESRGNTLDSSVLGYVNDAAQLIINRIVEMNSLFSSYYYDLTLDGSLEYSLPLYIDRILTVEDITSGATQPYDTEPVFFENRFKHLMELSSKIQYYKRGRVLAVPSKATGTLRVYYPIQPAGMFLDTIESTTSTSITFASATTNRTGNLVLVDDHYNGMIAVDKDSLEYHEITDWDASSLTASCGTWVNTPSEVSVCVPLSARFQELIHLEAGIAWRADLDDPIGELEVRARKIWQVLEKMTIKDNVQRSQHVTNARFN